jgi:outer membrane protein assembly factor BamB
MPLETGPIEPRQAPCNALFSRSQGTILAIAWLLCMASTNAVAAGPSAATITGILSRRQGVLVSIGVTDAALLANLHRAHGFLIHGLVADDTDVSGMREQLHAQHLYGAVSLRKLDGRQLPYADGLATVVVVDRLPQLHASGLALAETVRILSPYGTLVILNSKATPATATLLDNAREAGMLRGLRTEPTPGIAAAYTKPYPEDMDEWTHRYHDAAATGMSEDRSIKPVSRVQWLAGPDKPMLNRTGFQRGNFGGVTSGGRLYYVSCHDPSNFELTGRQISQRWHITARDAFNGALLWSRNLLDYYPELLKTGVSLTLSEEEIRKASLKKEGLPAADLGGSLVATADRLFGNLFGVPVAFSPQTGDLLKVYSAVSGIKSKLIHAHGLLLTTTTTGLVALDPDSGAVMWRREMEVSGLDRPYNYTGVLLAGKNIVALGAMPGAKNRSLTAFEPATGEIAWQTDLEKQRREVQALLWSRNGIIVMKWRTHRGVYVFSVDDGRMLWEYAPPLTKTLNVTMASGLVWLSFRPPNDTRELVAALRDRDAWDGITEGLDPQTGEVKKRYTGKNAMMIPSICNFANAISTPNYIITTRPLTFFDVKTAKRTFFDGAMHGCGFGVIPANGLVYAPANACSCFRAAIKSYGAWSHDDGSAAGRPQGLRLHKGPAYGSPQGDTGDGKGSSWPLFRHDAQRSSSTVAKAGGKIQERWTYAAWNGAETREALRADWRMNLYTQDDPLTAPVIQNGIAVVAAIHAHTVHAVEVKSGKLLWTHTVNSRIHTAPSLSRGRCFVGSADGTVSCLNLADGELVWAFRAAPRERLVSAFGQVESPWPILGDIVPDGDAIYFLAGRGASTDGGIYYYQLNSTTGEVLAKTRHSDTEELFRFDLLVSSGTAVHPANDRKKLLAFPVGGGDGARAKAVVRNPGKFLIKDYFWRYPGMFGSTNRYGGGQRVLGYTALMATHSLWANQVVTYRRHSYTGDDGKWYTRFGANEITAFVGRNPVSASKFSALKKPVRTWGNRTMYGVSEGSGNEKWNHAITDKNQQVEALIQTQDVVFAAGAKNRYARKEGGFLLALSADTGKELRAVELDAPPVADGLAAVNGVLLLADQSGKLICFRQE